MLEDIQFLKDLQKELQTQENDCQAAPRFWAIMDYKWVVTAEGHEDRVILFDSDACERVEIDDYVDEILNGDRKDEFSEEEIEELKHEIEWGSPSEIYNWIETYDDNSRFYPICEEEVSFIAPNTMFLTKAEAKRHLELNHYHYSTKAHTYAMTAWRAPKVEKLLKILEIFDWDKVNQLFTENRKLRDTQNKLIQLLQKADEYSDKLEWKLFWESKDKIVEEVMKKCHDQN